MSCRERIKSSSMSTVRWSVGAHSLRYISHQPAWRVLSILDLDLFPVIWQPMHVLETPEQDILQERILNSMHGLTTYKQLVDHIRLWCWYAVYTCKVNAYAWSWGKVFSKVMKKKTQREGILEKYIYFFNEIWKSKSVMLLCYFNIYHCKWPFFRNVFFLKLNIYESFMIFKIIELNAHVCYMCSDIQCSSICNWQQFYANLR